MIQELKTAVLIPCFNEEKSISKVVKDFRKNLPDAYIYVYDNNSTDKTADIAKKQGATVKFEKVRGKGNVVKRMFSDIEADIYIIVDGDSTYDATVSGYMIKLLIEKNLDMVVGIRKSTDKEAYRYGHVLGNKVLTWSVSKIFNSEFTDMLTGFRVMSKRFVKTFPLTSSGFEIETELTIHATEIGASFEEVETKYKSREQDSYSKLNTWSDGLKISLLIFSLFKDHRPLLFFSIFSFIFFLLSIFLATPIIMTWIDTGLVPRLPSAVLSLGLMIFSFFSLLSGIILDGISRHRKESKRLKYLEYKPVITN